MPRKRPLATAKEVAELLNVPETTLKQWRYRSVGPRWIRCNSMVRYDLDDVEAWVEANRQAIV